MCSIDPATVLRVVEPVSVYGLNLDGRALSSQKALGLTLKLKSCIREITPPLIWRAARKARHFALKNGAQWTDWTYGAEQPAEFYDERFESLSDLQRHYSESLYYPMWTVIADRVRHYGAESILDIGCGAGQLACLLRDQGLPRYSGLDFSPARVARARDICPEFDFFVEDVHKTDLIERRDYDLVVSTEFLEHIEADLDVLRRIPHGVRVLATVPNYPAAGHVRYFETADAVQQRYQEVLEELSINTLFMSPSGRVIYVMDGRTALTPASGRSTVTTSFAETQKLTAFLLRETAPGVNARDGSIGAAGVPA